MSCTMYMFDTDNFLSKKSLNVEPGYVKIQILSVVYVHLLANGGVFLKEKVNINVHTACTDAPSHASNNLTTAASVQYVRHSFMQTSRPPVTWIGKNRRGRVEILVDGWCTGKK